MIYTKIQSQSCLGSGEEDFYVFLPYVAMEAILFRDVKPFEQIINEPSTESLM